jgi:cytochrome c biogenesis protein CcdA
VQGILRSETRNNRWAILGPILALVGALGISIIGAILTGTELGTVVGGVEDASATSGNFLTRVGRNFPLSFAFSAGMVASVNPCGFPMLPAYLGLYVGEDTGGGGSALGQGKRTVKLTTPIVVGFALTVAFWIADIQTIWFGAFSVESGFFPPVSFSGFTIDRDVFPLFGLLVGFGWAFPRETLVSVSVTGGFVVIFAAVGVPIGLGAHAIKDVFPWVGLAIGVLLAVVGAYLLGGGNLYNNLAMRLSSKMGNANNNSVRGYFTFGLGYGTASLSCTLPIFLAVIGNTFTADTFLDSVWQFLLYAFGMGSVILILTVGMAVFKGTMVGGLRRMLPYVGTISAVLLLVSGAFIVYYWLTIGELLDSF